MLTPMLPAADAPSGGAVVMHGEVLAVAATHEVTVATFAWDTVDEARAAALRECGVRVHMIRREWQRRWELAPAWLRGNEPLRALRFRDPRMRDLVASLLAGTQFDIVEALDGAMGAYCFAAPVPRVLTEMEVQWQPRLVSRRPLRLELEGRRWVGFQRRVWRAFHRIQVFTPEDAAAALAIAPEVSKRLRVNPFGIRIPHVAPDGDEDSRSVVFVGNFMHPPNADAALWLIRQVMPHLRAAGARLTVVGAYPPRSVRRLATADVVVTGLVSDVEPFLRRAAVVVAPVRTGGGMRVKVLQAMALGKPVVTTALGARGIDAPDGDPPLAVAESAEAFAGAVAHLLASPSARRELGRRARTLVESTRSWAAFSDRLNATYEEIRGVPSAASPEMTDRIR
jgi:polysaccharide biosynthesis protein PslH